MIKIPMETYSRCVGYFRPISQWNKGKQTEFRERKVYRVPILKIEEIDAQSII